MAPHPLHTFLPGSLQPTELGPVQAYAPHDPHAAPRVPPLIAPHPWQELAAAWHEVPSQQPPLHVRPPAQLVPHFEVEVLQA
jgi:hypothetical protein